MNYERKIARPNEPKDINRQTREVTHTHTHMHAPAHTLRGMSRIVTACTQLDRESERKKSEIGSGCITSVQGNPIRDSWKKLPVHGAGQTPHPLMLHSFVGLGRSIRPNPPAENRRTEMIKWCLSPCSDAHTHMPLRGQGCKCKQVCHDKWRK